MRLYGYWRSGTSYRVRIALNMKGLRYTQHTLDLRTGMHRRSAYLALNPQGLVPALHSGDTVLTQSPAIIEWLEERFPDPPLLPADPDEKAVVRAMAALVACDIHPLNNARVLAALRDDVAADDAAVRRWAVRWIEEGFAALEVLVARHGRGYVFGDQPTLADCHVVPQVYSAARFGVSLAAYPHLSSAVDRASALAPFAAAHPDRQPDADAATGG